MLNRDDKKRLFLERYEKSYHKGNSMKGLFTYVTFYKYQDEDEYFNQAVTDIEMRIVHNAEQKFQELLESEDPSIVFKVAREILNSKFGKKYSNLTKAENGSINVKGDKTITFKFGNDTEEVE